MADVFGDADALVISPIALANTLDGTGETTVAISPIALAEGQQEHNAVASGTSVTPAPLSSGIGEHIATAEPVSVTTSILANTLDDEGEAHVSIAPIALASGSVEHIADAAPVVKTPTVATSGAVNHVATASVTVSPNAKQRVSPIRPLFSPTQILADVDDAGEIVGLPFTFWGEDSVWIESNGYIAFPGSNTYEGYYRESLEGPPGDGSIYFKGIFANLDMASVIAWGALPDTKCEYGLTIEGGGWGVTYTNFMSYAEYDRLQTFQFVIFPDGSCEINVDKWESRDFLYVGWRPELVHALGTSYTLPGWEGDYLLTTYADGQINSLSENTNTTGADGIIGRWVFSLDTLFSGAFTDVTVTPTAEGTNTNVYGEANTTVTVTPAAILNIETLNTADATVVSPAPETYTLDHVGQTNTAVVSLTSTAATGENEVSADAHTVVSPRALVTWETIALPEMETSVAIWGTVGVESMPIYTIPLPPAVPPAPQPEFDTATYGGNVIRPLFSKNVVMGSLSLSNDKPSGWTYTEAVSPNSYGVFRVLAWRNKIDPKVDITYLFDAPVQIQSLEFDDPFDDALATIQLPSSTGFNFPTWLREFTNIDVYWVPATTSSSSYPCINPITNVWNMYLHPENQIPLWQGYIQTIDVSYEGVTLQCQGALWQLDRYYAKPMYPLRPKLVENMIERAFDPQRRGLWTEPLVIDWEPNWKVYSAADYFKFITDNYGSKRYVPTGTDYVSDWRTWGGGYFKDKSGEKYAAAIGAPWTGFTTRNTGGWDKMLTGFVNQQLSILFTENTDGDGLQQGDQWTIMMEDRTPHMYVRRQAKDPDYYVCYGQPGVEVRLNRDGGMFNNVVYGTGRAYGDEDWSNFVQPTGTWTTWLPSAYAHDPDAPNPLTDTTRTWWGDVWPTDMYKDLYDGYNAENERNNDLPVVERYAQFPDGISEGNGQTISENWIAKDADPGWIGDITLRVDPLAYVGNAPVNMWTLKAGDTIFLKYFGDATGTLNPGTNKFHVSKVTMNPMDGTVTLNVDTKYRDLLSAEEAMAKGRDSLSPIKALQVGKKSILIQDVLMPWSNRAGSGCFPNGAKNFKRTTGFPYEKDTIAQRPRDIFNSDYKGSGSGALIQDITGNQFDTLENALAPGVTLDECFYVPIKAGASNMNNRWIIFPMLMAQAADIAYTEFAIYDVDGNVAPCEFHTSIWYAKPNVNTMPKIPPQYDGDVTDSEKKKYGGLWGGGTDADAWDLVRDNGSTWRDGDEGGWYTGANPGHMIIGWGNYDNPCGYYPRKKGDDNAQMTGIFKDTSPWHFDLNQWIDFQAEEETKNSNLTTIDYSAWVAVYVNRVPDHTWLYVMGRAYRKVAV